MSKKHIFPRDKHGNIDQSKIGSVKSFKTKNREYFPTNSLQIERGIEFTKLQTIISTGYSSGDLTEKHIEIIKALNAVKFVEASIIATDLVDHTSRLEDRMLASVELCALFFNEKDEDTSVWNDAIKDSKIQDWKDYGMEVEDFFLYALSLLQVYRSELVKSPSLIKRVSQAIKSIAFAKK